MTISLKDKSDKEAFLNEFKGNLFEFLTAKNLAKLGGSEAQFFTNFDPALRNRLSSYEQIVRELDEKLFYALPRYAEKAAHELYKSLLEQKLLLAGQAFNAYVLGKKMSRAESGSNPWKEVDILLTPVDESQKAIPVSLKLTKKGAYVNTKSAGLFSFYTQYFSAFKSAESYQEQLKQSAEEGFKKLARTFCEMRDINPLEDDFKGEWKRRNYPDLPGKLEEEERKLLHGHYHLLAEQMKLHLESFEASDPELFESCLDPMMGLGRRDIVQCICFTDGNELFPWIMTSAKEWREKAIGWRDYHETSSFERDYPRAFLQFRIKPMNKFTTAAYKVNCSLKIKEKGRSS